MNNRNKNSTQAQRWAVILAGGDGTRLLPLTRQINGDDRPKQFSAVMGATTLIEQTRRRAAKIVDPSRILYSLTRKHEVYFADQLAGTPEYSMLIQPYNHGTAQAILFSVMRLRQMDPGATVAFFPSDHHFANGSAFSRQMSLAFREAETRPSQVVLLGIEADAPEESYGWIEPGPRIGEVSQVVRFWEKPPRVLALSLLRRGCLWNSFVMVGGVSAFLELFGNAMPELFSQFESRRDCFGGLGEGEALLDIYRVTEAANFSEQVLSAQTPRLSVLSGRNLGWSDLGEPKRVFAIQSYGLPQSSLSFAQAV